MFCVCFVDVGLNCLGFVLGCLGTSVVLVYLQWFTNFVYSVYLWGGFRFGDLCVCLMGVLIGFEFGYGVL